ncbi:MAG: lmo0937 family membrane protein [Gemmatimonadota bacterium]|nr:lmo0937 family membrane protein [Gemmatimonadota bacterium]
MIWTIIVILLILWLLGGFVRPVGGLIHLLLVVILILFLIQLLG